jgi:heme-degrading monooxygenase HmoA
MTMMRLWHGEVPLEKADEYQQFMVDKAAPDYASIDGLLNIYFQRKDEATKAHFLLVTIWDSLASMKKFAGEQPEIAKYYLEDDDFLLEKEKHSAIYDIFYQQ